MNPKRNTESSKDAEIKALEAKLAELKGEETPEISFRQDEYILVMNLVPYTLNLSTGGNGVGKNIKFTRFGEKKKVLYKDLVDIIESNPGFVESGYFYIMNPELVRHHGLDEVYSKILTKEMMEAILSSKGSSDEYLDLYNTANTEQQRTIIQLIVSHMVENPEGVDLNVVDKLSRASGVKIAEVARETRELFTKEEQTETEE